MSRFRALVTPPPKSAFDTFERASEARLERAALNATAIGARRALRDARAGFGAAGLGRLGMALGAGSDLEKRGQVFRKPTGFSASGYIFIRSGSPRSRGALDAYTDGADIAPRNGRWLWIATDEIPRRSGRFRMTPSRYRKDGWEQKIGPLVQIKSIDGRPLLVVRGASVSAAGIKGRARSRTKTGRLRRGQREKELIVAFVAIPRTARAARIDVRAIVAKHRAELGKLIAADLEKGGAYY